MAGETVGAVGDADRRFRALLEEAEGDDGARSAALDALLARSMQVVTWAGSGEALRTLRNGKGEQALGLWSGEDTLVAAATRLGWIAAAGTLSLRSVDAREAIEAALAQGVQFVVIDFGSEHALELVGDELSLLLALKQKQSPKASTGAQPEQAAKPGKGKALIDIDVPFVHGRAEAAPGAAVVDVAAPDLLARAFAAPLDDSPGSKNVTPSAAPAPFAVASPPVVSQAHAPQASSAGGGGGKAGAPARTMVGHVAPAAPAVGAPAPKTPAAEDKPAPVRAAVKAHGEEPKPGAIKSAARALATMIGTSSGDAGAGASQGANNQDASDESVELADGALRPLELGLSEAALGAIAEALRSYPEIEWACEVSDGTEVPVIGLRVSPQFMTRAGEIEAAALCAGTARGAELRVLMLTEAAVMREARTHGRAFYPWKKRR
jgi:hypothetical protein